MTPYQPRRTMLYVPAHNVRFIEKSRTLDADSLIFDLQESVPPNCKAQARDNLVNQLQDSDFGHSETIIRVNSLQSEWGLNDLKAAVTLDIDGILFPRIDTAEQLEEAIYTVNTMGGKHLKIMANIESPIGVLNAKEIAAVERLDTIIMGTSDLANELKLNLTADRSGLITSMSLVILAARAFKKCVIDGPHFDLKNIEACEFSCRQARDLGFDGKTVTHPVQLNYTNDAFTPKGADISRAKAIIVAIEQANQNNRSMAVLDDKLIEPALKEWAERVISVYDRVNKIGQSELLGVHK